MKKVLVVDDSALMRKLLTGVLREGGYEVQTARNGAEGVDMTLQWQPDVVTLDINMPEMDGLTALSLLMAARPTPVIMVSSLTEKGALATFEALALGAVDFVPKPSGTISLTVEDIAAALLDKVRSATRARLGGTLASARRGSPPAVKPLAAPRADSGSGAGAGVGDRQPAPSARRGGALSRPSPPTARTAARPDDEVHGLVLIGVSTGGPRTLEDILPKLPADFPWPVLVAQHMPANFTDTFARRMDSLCPLNVREVSSAMAIAPGHVYIGRGGTDMAVSLRGTRLHVAPRPQSPSVLWHPSVEVMVETAMRTLPPDRLVGVMLTGMGNDGAAEMARLKQNGGRTIAESADTAIVFGMPQELIARGGASVVLPCTGIAVQLRNWLALRSTSDSGSTPDSGSTLNRRSTANSGNARNSGSTGSAGSSSHNGAARGFGAA